MKKVIKNWYIVKVGKIGENTVINLLNKLNPRKYTVINNILIKHPNGKLTQIDHIIVSRKGIFIIETKNYGGVLYGDYESRYWTNIKGHAKLRVYNCVKQNEGHIKAVKNLLIDILDYLSDRRYYRFFVSIIAIHDRCNIKVSYRQKKLRIIHFGKLIKTIKRINRRNLIPNNVKEDIILALKNADMTSKLTSKQHINQIKSINYH